MPASSIDSVQICECIRSLLTCQLADGLCHVVRTLTVCEHNQQQQSADQLVVRLTVWLTALTQKMLNAHLKSSSRLFLLFVCLSFAFLAHGVFFFLLVVVRFSSQAYDAIQKRMMRFYETFFQRQLLNDFLRKYNKKEPKNSIHMCVLCTQSYKWQIKGYLRDSCCTRRKIQLCG